MKLSDIDDGQIMDNGLDFFTAATCLEETAYLTRADASHCEPEPSHLLVRIVDARETEKGDRRFYKLITSKPVDGQTQWDFETDWALTACVTTIVATAAMEGWFVAPDGGNERLARHLIHRAATRLLKTWEYKIPKALLSDAVIEIDLDISQGLITEDENGVRLEGAYIPELHLREPTVRIKRIG